MEISDKLVPDAFGDPAERLGPRALCNAVTIAVVRQGASNKDSHVADVTATADADTTATIPHGLGAAPEEVTITWLKNEAAISLWRATTIDATNVVLTKATTMGSGVAGAQARVIIKRPHTLGQ